MEETNFTVTYLSRTDLESGRIILRYGPSSRTLCYFAGWHEVEKLTQVLLQALPEEARRRVLNPFEKGE